MALHQPLLPVLPVARELFTKTKWIARKGGDLLDFDESPAGPSKDISALSKTRTMNNRIKALVQTDLPSSSTEPVIPRTTSPEPIERPSSSSGRNRMMRLLRRPKRSVDLNQPVHSSSRLVLCLVLTFNRYHMHPSPAHRQTSQAFHPETSRRRHHSDDLSSLIRLMFVHLCSYLCYMPSLHPLFFLVSSYSSHTINDCYSSSNLRSSTL
jgi:hypothetical protein